MNKLILTTLTVALGAASSLAMPTKADLKKAQPLVSELMSPSLSAFKSARGEAKTAAAEKVADASSSFAKEAETEAAKFLLLKGAVTYYVRAEKYDKAADTVKTLQSEIKDVPPSVIAEITGKATSRISESKAPALYSLYRAAKLKSKAAEDVKTLAAKLKKVQSDALQRKYAEALALSGDWKAAYAAFAKVKNADLQKVAEAEASGKAKNAESGEFWWTYEPATEDAEDFFKSHAAAYYRRALDAGEITGLKKNLIEQRIRDMKTEIAPQSADFSVSKTKSKDDEKLFMEVMSATRKCERDSTERTRIAVTRLFPGWSLDSEVQLHDVTGFHANHRGRNNVVCVHPKDMKTPAVLSRTLTLSNKNPCLLVEVASWRADTDFLLSVRMDGKDVVSNRRICTPDNAPWEDVIVPLSNWRGRTAKIEIVFTANGWHSSWPENPMVSRIEIVEGTNVGRIIDGR